MVRFKNRYILAELVWRDRKIDESFGEAAILQVLRDSIEVNFGDFGLGQALSSLQVKYYNCYTQLCVIRCSRDGYRQVWAAMTMVTDINHRAVLLRLLHLSGTIGCCKEMAMKLNSLLVERSKLGRHQAGQAAALQQRITSLEL